MSRYCGNKDSTEVIKAAELWKDKCLLNDGSVFSDENIWTLDSFAELHHFFTDNPDEGSDSFLDKLENQLSSAKNQTKKLAAEMLWFMQLFVSDAAMGADTKRQQLERVYSWSGGRLDMNQPLLQEPLEYGIGHPGIAYNTRRWAEFNYFIDLCSTFKSLPVAEKNQLVSDPWIFSEWLDGFEKNGKRQLRHIINFLLFPDYFERISTISHKLTIINAFHDKNLKPGECNFTEVDKELFEIREELTEKYDTKEIDFYGTTEINLVWQKPKENDLGTSISRENVFSAKNEIDERGIRADETSSTYDILIAGKRYPPKLVYSLAHKHAGGEVLDRSSFHGGENTQCFRVLRDLGFCIERKDFVVELLKAFIAQADAGTDLTTRQYPREFQGLKIKVSFGQGVFSHVPWVTFTGYEQTTQKGIYPVFLYYKSIGVLVLAYGISETHSPHREWQGPQIKEKIKDYLLRESEHAPERYGESYVHSVYRFPANFAEVSVTADLDALINEYHSIMEESRPIDPEPEPMPAVKPSLEKVVLDPKAIAQSFASALKDANIRFGARHDQVVQAFTSSLMTKPLVILTGLSGSGKTQIAIRFGEWLGAARMLVVPVRPDWTGAEAIFGYEDALKPTNNGRAAWAVPETLQFILTASSDPHYPYLLVLDEMNLAHVERYFADVLSGMESEQPCLPNLVLEPDGCWRVPNDQAKKLSFPKNVFIVGTVNVDETTYMFSPKVLDRANTFEFRVTAADLADEYHKPVPCQPGDMGLVRGFLEIGMNSGWHYDHDAVEKASITNELRQVHSLLAEHGLEFGHRVFFESQRFAAIYSASQRGEGAGILDLILMQKILPRLHGSRRRLEDLLRALTEFCFSAEIVKRTATQPTLFEPDDQDAAAARFPISYSKLTRMLKSLRANQFTSFTE